MTQIRLRNSLTRKVEDFQPIDPKNVRMYLCGPTVYDRAHLGNARPVVVFDVLYRLLRHVYGSEHVTYVRNFTDVDDKINATALARKAAGAEGSLEDLIRARTEETIGWYHADMDALGALRPDHEPRATDYIGAMIAMIETLIADGHAYAAEGHVLFRVRSYKEYGALSGRTVDDMIAGARVEVAPFKEDPMDFVLWKPSDDELPGWESPWGRGRPGWHIECSAMSYELLGASFDIHGGGIDLQFPHHENEIAQSCCAHPEGSFARYWLHNEMLQVEGKKMSKSLGNFFTVRDLLDGHDGEKGIPGEVIRFVFLQTHYTKPMDWTAEKARQAEKTLRRIAEFLGADPLTKPWIDTRYAKPPQEFVDALANDLNTALALSLVHKYLKEQDEFKLVAALRLLGFNDQILVQKFSQFHFEAADNEFSSGYQLSTHGDEAQGYANRLNELGKRFSEIRKVAMATKDFGLVDALKVSLTEAGVEVRMSKAGVELLPGPDFDPAKLEGL
ncbi:cysteine--tRNA ligase [Thioclava sp. L04-15]|uniref:cysteine--tRNA ligase n=1 Tax=Thioclava sp. L04-15 TaxID=1915318 RepID=UPI000997D9B5|nr:cysteine--tRNA ligase [Thioclava sp. L04-15]OOY28518.1 cysteine--tRNA ligase [Thioclava sp. L04-15]